jgi:hypothetical protein
MTQGHVPVEGAYSEVADQQLTELEQRDAELYNDILTVCELVFTDPGRAQAMSAAIRAQHGIVFRLPVPGRHPFKVFWSSDGPRIEAVFPHE